MALLSTFVEITVEPLCLLAIVPRFSILVATLGLLVGTVCCPMAFCFAHITNPCKCIQNIFSSLLCHTQTFSAATLVPNLSHRHLKMTRLQGITLFLYFPFAAWSSNFSLSLFLLKICWLFLLYLSIHYEYKCLRPSMNILQSMLEVS